MADITFSLDGQDVIAHEGETILQVARRMGKTIPTLCHDPRLEPFTSCYVCLVELEGRPAFVPSCATKAAAGMRVRTDTPAVFNARKLALELLMSAHNADCVAPCRLQCPANVDIQTYIAQIAAGEFSEALKTIKRTNPFPSACGRICPHTCELQCRRNRVDEPVAINPLKRFVADLDALAPEPYVPEVAPDTGKRIAVVGGGPAGLTAAYYLRQMGHAVTVFEMNPKPGGMLRYGIPRYRLPEDALDREIAHILSLGIDLRTDSKLGRDFDLEELKRQGFDAVFLGIGAWSSSQLGVPGEDVPGVVAGIDFLCRVACGERTALGEKVVVVGGGNTAVDAARTARRLGADVTILYRRTRDEMPAERYEVEEAEQEGVRLHFLAAPVAVTSDNGRASHLRAIRMELGEPDASGRRRPVPVAGSEYDIAVDTIIAAIGQRPDCSCVKGGVAPSATRAGTIQGSTATMQTDLPWVFAGGDCLTGTATAIEAIACGRKAALSMDRYLRGEEPTPIGKPFSDSLGELDSIPDEIFAEHAQSPRAQTCSIPVERRLAGFEEVEGGIDRVQALCEAMRCLECGCSSVETCSLRQYCQDYGAAADRFEVQFLHRPLRKDHPFIIQDPNKCIVCGRCVRICAEQQAVAAWGFVDRGLETTIQPALGKALMETDCDACGQCVNTCPTGALSNKRVLPKLGPYYVDRTDAVCGFCGVACRLTVETTRGRYVQVSTEPGAYHNRGNLCVDGSYGHRFLETLARLQRPRVRAGGELVDATWQTAIQAAADGLNAALQAQGVAVLIHGPMTDEDAYVLARLTRTALRSNRILALDGPARPVAFERALQPEHSCVVLDDLQSADLIWHIGADPFQYAPIAGIELRRAAAAGVPLLIVGQSTTRLDEVAARVLRLTERDMVAVFRALRALATGVTNGDLEDLAERIGVKVALLSQAVARLRQAARPVITVTDSLSAEAAAALGGLLEAVGAGGRVLVLPRGGNASGRAFAGLHPVLLPAGLDAGEAEHRERVLSVWGNAPVLEPGPDGDELRAALRTGQLGAVLVVNTDPRGLPLTPEDVHPGVFTIVLELGPTPLDTRANVLLPAPALAESTGTVMSLDRRLLRTCAARTPAGGRGLFDILSALAAALGQALPFEEPMAVWSELELLAPSLIAVHCEALEPAGEPLPLLGG